MRRGLALLFLAIAVGVVVLLRVVHRPAKEPSASVATSAAPTTATGATPAAQLDEAAQAIDAAGATPARTEVAAPDEDADAIWIEGRLAFPPRTPADEHVEVVARHDKSTGEPRKFPVEADGSFRVAYPRETLHASVDLAAKYLYLASPVVLEPSKRKPSDPPLALAPVLGGRVHGRIVLSPKALVLLNDVPGSDIRATPRERSSGWRSGGAGDRHAQVDRSLSFELNALAGDAYWIHAELKDATRSDIPDLRVPPGRTTETEIEVSLGTSIHGRVVDEKGAPLAEVNVTASVGGSIGSWSRGKPATAEDGSFLLDGIQPGKTTLEAYRDPFATAKIDLGTLVEGDQREDVEIVLSVGGRVTGKVVWPDGRPAADARIEVALDPASGREDGFFRSSSSKSSCVAGPDGSFAIGDLGEKPIVLQVRADPNGIARVAGVRPGTTDLLVELQPARQIRGRAVDDAGQPIPFFRVTARLHDGTPDWTRDAGGITAPGQNGSFAIDGLHDGPWDVGAEATGCVKSATLRVLLPSDSEGIELVLPRAVSVSGIVVDPSGTPVNDAKVTSRSRTDLRIAMSGRDHSDATTDAEGRFTLRELEPGSRTVSASAQGFAESEPESVDLSPGATTGELRLRLRLGGRIAGVVVDESGKAIPGPRITAFCFAARINKNATADADGRFEIPDLAPGTYRVQALPTEREIFGKSPESMEDQMVLASKRSTDAVVTEGATTEVVLGAKKAGAIHVHGRIVSDRAAPKCRISFSAANLGQAQTVSSEGSGLYELDVDKPGSYYVAVSTVDSGVRFGGSRLSERLDVPDGSSFEHDFVLPSGRISGRVLEADGSPAAKMRVTLMPEAKSTELPSSGSTTTDDRGAFVFEFLKAQTYRLDANPSDWIASGSTGRGARTGLVLADGGKIDDVEIRLEAGARLEGTVVGPDGRAVVGATVLIGNGGGFNGSIPEVSDASGRFARDGLPAGSCVVRASTKSLVAQESTVVALRSGETARVTISLGKGTRLRVAVQDAGGTFVSAALAVVDARGQPVPTGTWMDDVEFGAGPGPSGTLVGTVPQGRLKITATNHDHVSVTGEFDVSGDEQTVTLKFGG